MSVEQDNQEIVKIWQTLKPKVASLCKYKLRNYPDEIEDLISEVFKALIEEVRKRKLPEKPEAWLLKVTYNLINKKYKEINKQKRLLVNMDFENTEHIELQVSSDFTDEMIDDMDIEELKENLLEKLSREEQALIEYICEEKLTMKEVAALLNITADAAKSRFYRVKIKVKDIAKKDVEEFL